MPTVTTCVSVPSVNVCPAGMFPGGVSGERAGAVASSPEPLLFRRRVRTCHCLGPMWDDAKQRPRAVHGTCCVKRTRRGSGGRVSWNPSDGRRPVCRAHAMIASPCRGCAARHGCSPQAGHGRKSSNVWTMISVWLCRKASGPPFTLQPATTVVTTPTSTSVTSPTYGSKLLLPVN